MLVEATLEALVSCETCVERIQNGDFSARSGFWEGSAPGCAHSAGEADRVGVAGTLAVALHCLRHAIAVGIVVLYDGSGLAWITHAAARLGEAESDRRVVCASVVAIATVSRIASPRGEPRITKSAMSAVTRVSFSGTLCQRTSVVRLAAVVQRLKNPLASRLIAFEMRRRGN